MRVHVQPASAADLDQLVRLDGEARAHLGAHRGGSTYLVATARPEPAATSLRADLDDPSCRVLVGRIGEEAVGYATARLVELRDGRRIADVGELFVEPPARGVGVGAALMDALLEWADEQGCAGVDARVLPGDRASKNFFEAFGLVARAITVHRDLRT